jgi:CheY-like chemotaxis protein
MPRSRSSPAERGAPKSSRSGSCSPDEQDLHHDSTQPMPRTKNPPPDPEVPPSLARAAGTVPSTRSVDDRSLLLVGADVDNRESIAEALQSEAFRVHPMATAAEALKVLDGPRCPSLILLDLSTPGLGGRELLAAVALRPDRELFRIIPMSAAPEAEALATRPCVVQVLHKPFALEKLLAAVRRHV